MEITPLLAETNLFQLNKTCLWVPEFVQPCTVGLQSAECLTSLVSLEYTDPTSYLGPYCCGWSGILIKGFACYWPEWFISHVCARNSRWQSLTCGGSLTYSLELPHRMKGWLNVVLQHIPDYFCSQTGFIVKVVLSSSLCIFKTKKVVF